MTGRFEDAKRNLFRHLLFRELFTLAVGGRKMLRTIIFLGLCTGAAISSEVQKEMYKNLKDLISEKNFVLQSATREDFFGDDHNLDFYLEQRHLLLGEQRDVGGAVQTEAASAGAVRGDQHRGGDTASALHQERSGSARDDTQK